MPPPLDAAPDATSLNPPDRRSFLPRSPSSPSLGRDRRDATPVDATTDRLGEAERPETGGVEGLEAKSP